LRLNEGKPLDWQIRRRMEKSFATNLGAVRVHRNAGAAATADRMGAKAFAYGPNIVLGSRGRANDLGLIAHETAHTIQQRGNRRLQRFSRHSGDAHESEARGASAAVVSGQRYAVTGRTNGSRVQGDLGDWLPDLPNPLDWIAGKANLIPGFRMFTIILGVNPINMSAVDASPANILRALIEIMPGGGLVTEALDNSGVFEKVAAWGVEQVKALGLVGSAIKEAVTAFIAETDLTDLITDPGGVWARGERIFTEPIERIKSFAEGLVDGIIAFVKEAILKPLAVLASKTKGWDLLCAVLGTNPITGESVTPSAEVLIGGFMKLIGEEEVWARIQKTGAIGRCWDWFQSTMNALVGFVSQIPDLAIAAFKSLELWDIVLVPRALIKVGAVFANFLGDFFSWAGTAMWNLLEIVFDVVSPGAWEYIQKTGAALKSILKNPLPFMGNLVKAAKLGFQRFSGNFLTHLKNGLLDWLTGSLPGVYIPKAISLPEVGKFALSVLGITWAKIRGKLVKALGPSGEKIMAGLEFAFDVILALKDGGPAAAWKVIQDKLTGLKDQVIGGITSMVTEMVVTKAVPKLVAMFIPGAGFISAIVSIYETIMVFVDKISKIIQVVTGFINSIVAIANGVIDAAAAKVESVLAGLLSLAISFLAGFAGLGRVADKVRDVIKRVQTAVDKAIDAAIAFIISKAKKLFAKLFGGKDNETEQSKAVKQKVRTELAGKEIKDAEQANSLISSVYSTYSSQGLKGIRLVVNPSTPKVANIRVSASIAEVVANLPLTSVKEAGVLKDFAMNFDFLAGGTRLYVYYDVDNKTYSGSPINNDPGGAHAEAKFASGHLGSLRGQIAAHQQKGTLKTPPGQPVKVELNLNRITCPRCSAIVAGLASGSKDMVFLVKASSVSNEATFEVHAQWIADLIDKGVVVEPLGIWPEIKKKFIEVTKKMGKGEIAFKGQSDNFLSFVAVAQRIDENLGKEQGVKDLIDRAKQLLEDKKKGSKDNLNKVPPKGSGA
jgi:hypothetical protein